MALSVRMITAETNAKTMYILQQELEATVHNPGNNEETGPWSLVGDGKHKVLFMQNLTALKQTMSA